MAASDSDLSNFLSLPAGPLRQRKTGCLSQAAGENQDKALNCTCRTEAALGWTAGGLRTTNTQVLKDARSQSLAWTHSSAEAGRRLTSLASGRETAPRTGS